MEFLKLAVLAILVRGLLEDIEHAMKARILKDISGFFSTRASTQDINPPNSLEDSLTLEKEFRANISGINYFSRSSACVALIGLAEETGCDLGCLMSSLKVTSAKPYMSKSRSFHQTS